MKQIRIDVYHTTGRKRRELSAKDIYRYLDTLGLFLNVIEGDKSLIQRVQDSQAAIVPLLPGAPETDVSQDITPPSNVKHDPVIGVHGTAIPPVLDAAKVFFDSGLPKLSDEQYKAAIDACDAVVRQNPDSPDAYNDRGIVILRQGDYRTAIYDFNRATHLAPNYVPAYTNRATAQLRLGQYKDAIKECNKALDLKSNDAPAYTRRGSARYTLGEYDEAIADYNKAVLPALIRSINGAS